jgi:hypothetical protein
MPGIYSKNHPHRAVREEFRGYGIPEPRLRKIARFIFDGLSYSASVIDRIPPKMEKYDCTKEDEDEFNSF